jgi:aldehyde dehydrogenase (NAD+)
MQTKLFIDGEFVAAQNGSTSPTLAPHDGAILAEVASAGPADVDLAVNAAGSAFAEWSATSHAERGRLLLRLADLIEAHAAELAELESRDTGHPIRDTTRLDIPRAAAAFRYFGGMADKLLGSVIPVEPGFLNYVTRVPLGVVGQIVPWNFPMMFYGDKLAPALAAGNTVVLKPAELTPLSALRLCELLDEAGFPAGVVNVVPGPGSSSGQRMAEHTAIAKLSFTGSTRVGREIIAASATNIKRLSLELGGKGANIVFADADLEQALRGTAFAIFQNQGQACIAGARLIVEESIADEFIARLAQVANAVRVGNPLDGDTEMGPLTSASHRDRVLEFVAEASDEGGRVLAGGSAPTDPGLEHGYYVRPTLVEADPSSRIAQEEVFGPVLTIMRFGDEDEAVRMANSTDYGLGAGLWTTDLSRAHRVAAQMRAGMVWVNTYKRTNPGSPFGGVKASGYGRERGFEVMNEYTEAHSVWINVEGPPPPSYGGA